MKFHPDHEEHAARRRWVTAVDKDGNLDWCRAGGLENFARVGLIGDHPNYGFPHVVDHTRSETDTNCIFCGKELEP